MKTIKTSLSALSASVLICLTVLQAQQAYAVVPNPTSFIEDSKINANNADTSVSQVAVLTTKVDVRTERPKTPDQAPADMTSVTTIEAANNNAQDSDRQALLVNCATLTQDAMRLACYDTLARGDMPNAIENKRPIQLGETIWQTIKGNPRLVYSDAAPTVVLAGDKQGRLSAEDAQNLERVAKRYTPLSLAYDLDRNNTPLWSTRPHNPMYVLPLFVNSKPNRHPATPNHSVRHYTGNEFRTPELKFQLSVKVKAAEDLLGTDADLWVGYTQQSHWQVYNGDYSRPFRAHDYQPEFFLTQPVYSDLPWGGKLRMIGAGAVHHSNGESENLSRSWNRTYLLAGMEWGQLTLMPRIWGRILKEGNDRQPDDNPDILDYYGYGDVRFLYQLENNTNLSGTVRYNPKSGKGALQLDYVRSLGRGVSGYIQVFQGYGQSLIDYNHESTGIGFGLMLNDWMGL